MRLRGVHHIELSVLDYEASIDFFDRMFGWLGYKSFWTLDIGYRSTYYMARFPFFHSYIGIQPARTGDRLAHADHATGIHHVAIWSRNRREVDEFYESFLLQNNIKVTDPPAEYPVYAPGYYAVFFDDPITGIHFELCHTPMLPSPSSWLRTIRALKKAWKEHPEWEAPPWKQAWRKLESRREQS
jgi:catechol 2,3-dioxygenase-like lactoylglutathione lyase family enzyme